MPRGSVALPALPGLDALGERFARKYVEMCERNGWHPAGILTVLSRESGLNPKAQLTTTDTKTGQRGPCLSLESPKNCAVGLLQWNRVGLGKWAEPFGLSSLVNVNGREVYRGSRKSLEKIARMSPEKQLDLVEAYYRATLSHLERDRWPHIAPEDFYLPALGYSRSVGGSDAEPLIRSMDAGGTSKENAVYKVNAGLDFDGDGVISVGDMRAKWQEGFQQARGEKVLVVTGEGSPRSAALFILPALAGTILYKAMR